jgi:hypothetical protein
VKTCAQAVEAHLHGAFRKSEATCDLGLGEVVLIPQTQQPTFWRGQEAQKVSEDDTFERLSHHILSFWVGFGHARALQRERIRVPAPAADGAERDVARDRGQPRAGRRRRGLL